LNLKLLISFDAAEKRETLLIVLDSSGISRCYTYYELKSVSVA